jgi:hypothetical protein
MAKNSPTYDVFVVYDRRDAPTAVSVVDVLRAHGLAVFFDVQQIAPGANIEDAIWQAMAESHALVVVLPEEIASSWLAFELGAAKAWNKPIYAVSAFSAHKNIPASLRGVQVLPLSRVEEIAQSIATTSDRLSEEDIAHLGDAYASTGVAVDQLLLQPQQLAAVVKQFNKKSGRKMSGEQIMWHMLRLRKQAMLPVLKKRNMADIKQSGERESPMTRFLKS